MPCSGSCAGVHALALGDMGSSAGHGDLMHRTDLVASGLQGTFKLAASIMMEWLDAEGARASGVSKWRWHGQGS